MFHVQHMIVLVDDARIGIDEVMECWDEPGTWATEEEALAYIIGLRHSWTGWEGPTPELEDLGQGYYGDDWMPESARARRMWLIEEIAQDAN